MTAMGQGCVKTLTATHLAKNRLHQKLVELRSACEEWFWYPLFSTSFEFSHSLDPKLSFSRINLSTLHRAAIRIYELEATCLRFSTILTVTPCCRNVRNVLRSIQALVVGYSCWYSDNKIRLTPVMPGGKMVDKESHFISSKTFLIGIALFGLIGLSALLLWRSPCDDIFAQAAPELKVSLKVIENEGAFAVSREKIQELSESAQKVGLHLKTCCAVLDGGKLDSQQFQQCIDKASGYEKQIVLVAQQIREAAEAKERGATDVVQSKIADIGQTIDVATGNAETFARFIEEEMKPPPVEKTGGSGGKNKANQSLPVRNNSQKENESNDQITAANVIQFGGSTKGVVASDKDRDYYRYRTPGQMSGKTRIIMRKLSSGGFIARVSAYDQAESKIASSSAGSDDPVSFAFKSVADSDYYSPT